MQTNFSQKSIADKARAHFVAIALDIWGDREATWIDGRRFSEKQLAAFLKVQFTPTLLFFDERGAVVARLNGYYPPHRFDAVLDYAACDELHREGFRRTEVRALLARFDVARFALSERSAVITPDGARMAAEDWARELGIAYTPSLVFFDSSGKEAFRIDTYLRPFHLAGSLDYVARGAYRREPSFQRFLQSRAREMRGRGETVDLWR